MSRYLARVRQHDTLTGHFACDSLHVDRDGNLHLTLRRNADEVLTVARFQYGHWSSYELEIAPEPAPDSFAERGNQLRAREAAEMAALTAEWQSARTQADCAPVVAALDLHRPHRGYSVVQCAHCQTGTDAPDADFAPWPCATYTALTSAAEQDAKAEHATRPCVGSIVHVRHSNADSCVVGDVEQVVGDALVISTDGREPRWGKHLTATHDESRQADGSWHWPCGELLAEAASPAPVTVNVTIHGAQREAINKQLLAEYRAYPGLFRR